MSAETSAGLPSEQEADAKFSKLYNQDLDNVRDLKPWPELGDSGKVRIIDAEVVAKEQSASRQLEQSADSSRFKMPQPTDEVTTVPELKIPEAGGRPVVAKALNRRVAAAGERLDSDLDQLIPETAAPDREKPLSFTDQLNWDANAQPTEAQRQGARDALGLDQATSEPPVAKEPYDERKLGQVQNPQLARELALGEQSRRDEAARLQQAAEQQYATGADKKLRPAAAEKVWREADVKEREAARLKQEAAGMTEAELARLETNAAVTRVESADEAHYIANREKGLMDAASEAKDKLGNIKAAQKLVEQATVRETEAERDYETVSNVIAVEVSKIEKVLNEGKGAHKADLLDSVRAEDRLAAAKDIETLLGVDGEPLLSQTSKDGKVLERVYNSDKGTDPSKKAYDKLLIVERWDVATGRLISLNTIVAEQATRVEKGWWRQAQTKLSHEVEGHLADLRQRDQAGNTPNSGSSNEGGLGFNIGFMHGETYQPTANPAKKRRLPWWLTPWTGSRPKSQPRR